MFLESRKSVNQELRNLGSKLLECDYFLISLKWEIVCSFNFYCVPIAEMGGILSTLMIRKTTKQLPVPQDIVKEVKIAQRVLSDLPSVNSIGEQVPFNCPGCGGVLWKMDKGFGLRYRCHTGHAYTATTLLAEQTEKIEETMWTALRMFEERKNLLTTIANSQKGEWQILPMKGQKCHRFTSTG